MNGLNSFHIAVLTLSGLILLLLLTFLFRTKEPDHRGRKKKTEKDRNINGKPCPLCGEILMPGERVHSVIYPGKPDSLMEIHGCRHCEGKTAGSRRICPVCGKEVPASGVVIARVFEKPGKNHVHVLGCSGCYSGKSKIRRNP